MKKIVLSFIGILIGAFVFAQTPASIYSISYVSPADLAACNDSSQYLGDTVKTRGVVVTAGNLSEVASGSVQGGSRPFIYLVDTANGGAPGSFKGIEIMGAAGSPLVPVAAIENAQAGDILEITGIVSQYQGGLQMTPLSSTSVTLISSTTAPTSQLIAVGDLNDASRVNKLPTGEQWEGSFVEFQNVTVVAVSLFGGNRVSFDVADSAGNQINVSDEFLAQKLSSFTVVNPNSPNSIANGGTGTGSFVPPVVGTIFSSLKGMIRHSENGCTNGTGRGYELNPFDSTHYVKGATPPAITAVKRLPIVPNAIQTVDISADIVDNDGTVVSATLFYSADQTAAPATFTSVIMANTAGRYSATIPAFPLDTIVRYYIQAVDDSANVTTFPSPNYNSFYTVRANGLTIMDVQNPGENPNGDSPFTGDTVTFTGATTATLNQFDLGYVYLQDTVGLQYAGVYCTGNATLGSLGRGDVATITGVVTESFGFTTINVINVVTTSINYNIPPISLTPDSTFAAKGEMYESMLISLDDPNNGKIAVIETDLTNGEYGLGLAGSSDYVRVLTGRVSGTFAQSSLNVSLITDTFYVNNQGIMNVPAILTDTNQDMDAMIGILWYSFGAYKLTPRHNSDLVNFSEPLIYVSNKELKNNNYDLTYFPNPAQNNVTIQINSTNLNQLEVFFYDMKGQLMKSNNLIGNSNSIDVSNFNNGIYIVRVMNGAELIGTSKLVISK